MDEQIMFERGTSGKMENLGLSWSLDYKEHIVLTTQACWALPPLVPEFSAGGQVTPWRVS